MAKTSSLRPLAWAAALAAAVAVLSPLTLAPSVSAVPQIPPFLADLLGPSDTSAPLVRTPAAGVRIEITAGGYTVAHDGASVALAGAGQAFAWNRFAGGVSRETPFGFETITVEPGRTEQYLTVTERQGPQTWRWKLASGSLVPRIGDDGGIGFVAGAEPAGLRIAPVEIFDAGGNDVTPNGLEWELGRERGGWWLELALDDANLPLPYVIDPAVDYPTPLFLSNSASTATGSWNLTGTAPLLPDATTRTSLCSNCTGYVPWQPGVDNGVVATPSAVPTGQGWIADTSGATGFPAGSWSFTVQTDVPDLLLASGQAILAVGVWKGTVSGGAFSPTQTLLPPTDDPAAQDLRTSVLPVTTTVTYSLPQFSLAAGETLYVEYWRKQVVGINDANLSRRHLDFVVNDGIAKIAHPAADDMPPASPTQSISETSAASFVSSSTLYYRPNGGLSGATFTVASSASDSGSGIAKITFPGLTGGMAPTTATDDTTSPYSQTYSWSFGATESGTKTVSAHDNAGNSSTGNFTIAPDSAGPTGHSVTLSGGPVYTTPSVPLVLFNGTDGGGSGVNPATGSLGRDSAPLVGGACGTFSGTWFGIALVGGADTGVKPGNCYRYRYMVTDNVGNNSAWSTPSVDAVVVNSGVGFHASSSGGTVGSSLTLNRPAGTVVNDLLLAQVTVRSTSIAITEPSGWTFVRRDNAGSGSNQLGQAIYYRFAGPSEPASYTWTFSGSIDASGGIVAEAGVSPTSPIDVSGGLAGSGTSVTAPSVTTTSSGDRLVGFFGVGASTAHTPPAGMTEHYDAGGGQTAVSAADENQALAGASGTRTATAISAASNSPNIGQLVALRKDSIPPVAPTISLSESAADAFSSGSTLFYRPAGAGSFNVNASASDGESGLQAIVLPGLAAGFTPTVAAAATSRTYSWTSGASDAGAKTVTAYDNAGNTSTASFSLAPDSTPPTGGSVTYPDGADADGVVTITTADGSDAGAGLAAGTGMLERQTATFASETCGVFGSWLRATSPDIVPPGTCARYQYRISDRVGNEAVYASANVVTVAITGDLTPPAAPVLTLAESEPDEYVAGSTLFYNPGAGNSGSFTIGAASSDLESGIGRVDFPAVFGLDGGSDDASPYEATYLWSTFSTASGAYAVTVVNGAGLTSASDFTVTPDTAGPTISLSAPAADAAVRNGAMVSASAFDALAGVAEVEFGYCAAAPCAWPLATPIGSDATTPYTAVWSAQPADGTYVVVARALDHVGNATDAAPVTVIVDNTAPVATQNNPGTPLENTVTLQATASDALSGIATVTFEVSPGGQEDWTAIGTDTASPYSFGWDTLTVNDGRYDLRVLVDDRAGNSALSAVVRNRQVTNHPPVISITSPGDFYLNGSEPDPFTITAQSPNTNLRDVEFFSCSDASTNCATGTWISLGLDDTPPYAAAWAIDADGNRALKALVTNQSFAEGTDVNNVLIDRSPPSGGSVTYAAGYDADGSVPLTFDPGTDAGSGVDASSGLTERQTAALANGACGTFGAWESAPFNPDSVGHGNCARYRFHVSDEAGNEAVYESASIVKVDLTPPSAPMLTLTETEPDEHVVATTLYYNPSLLNTGEFTAGAVTSDPESGIERVSFPDVFLLDGGDASSAPYTRTYSWTSSDNAFGAKTVSARNGASLSTTAAFTVFPDTTAPVTTDDTASTGFGWQNAPVTVNLMPSDTGAGVAATHFTTDGSPPTTGSAEGSSVSLASDGAYTVRYFSVDQVGNVEPVVTADEEIRIDATSPTPPALTLSESSAFAHVAGAEVFVNPAQAGTYTVTAESSDAMSGIEKIRFPGPVDDLAAPYEAVFAPGALSGAQAVTAFDNAGNTAESGFIVTPDTAGPAGGEVSYPDGYDADGSVVVATADGTDALASVEATSRALERQIAPLADDVCGAFGAWAVTASPDTVPEASCARYRYRVSDRVGNETVYVSANVVRVDLTPPTAALVDPGANLSGTVVLASTAADSASGVASVAFQRSTAGANDWVTVPASWDTTTAPDGFYDLRVVVTDRAGNVSASASVTDRRVDNTIPTVLLAAPGPYLNATSPDPFTISATTLDGDVASVEIFRCSDASLDCATGTWISLGFSKAPPHSATWALDPDGNRALRADALDAAGNLASTVVNVTIDRDAPAAVKLATTLPPATPTSSNTIAVTLTDVSDLGSGVGGFSYQWDNDPAGAPDAVRDAGAETTTVTSPVLPDGSWYLHVRTVDAAGNWGETAHVGPFLIDATAPAAVLVGGADLSSPVRLGRSIGVAWSAAADAAAYDVRYQAAPRSGSFGEHVLWQAATTSTSGSFTGAPGTTYCFSARAYDAVGNVTPWTSDQCTALPLNNTSLAHRGTWAKKRSTGSYLGTYSATSTKGARLVRSGVGAKQIALVATKCRGCGTVGVYWNGVLLKKVSLARSSTARKQVIRVATFTSLRRGTVKIVVLSSGKPVFIEGLGANPL